ncbi:thiamine pyrophosphate-binding protein [Brevibacterium litoralis]|uniref:thiamine pyrophosphate-binding protein n=1 Tax=Brevibacterium litoralis TaxID=3138935 RepID=UPI0032EAE88C
MIRCLAAHGVTTVLGIPGTHNIEFYRGLGAHGIRHVAPRHEQGGVYAADAMARATGRTGVVLTTSGPGLTNALTGLANAHGDSLPVLVISPGMPRGAERRDTGDLHETRDQRARPGPRPRRGGRVLVSQVTQGEPQLAEVFLCILADDRERS